MARVDPGSHPSTGRGRGSGRSWPGGRALRRTPAVWLAIPFGAMALILLGTDRNVTGVYGLARASAAHTTLVVIGAFAAVCAAWETETLRQLWGRLVVTRPWWRVLAARLAPTLGITTLMMAVVYATALLAPPGGSGPAVSGPGWQFPLLTLLGVTAWTLFGAAATLSAGRLIALPAALLVPYMASTLPSAWEPLWLRHATGILFDCCGTGQILDGRAMTASTAVLGALAVVSLCVAAVRLGPAGSAPWPAAVLAAAVLAAATALVAGATGLGASPAAPRPVSDLVCADRVCLWPEDRDARRANRDAWDAVRAAWARLGLPELPDTVSAATAVLDTAVLGTPTPAGDVTTAPDPVAGYGIPVAVTSDDTRDVLLSMTVSVPRAARGCTEDYDDQRRNRTFDDLSYLLLIELGMRQDLSATGLAVSVPEPRSEDAQRLWQATRGCR